jgi:hypothetical protein
LPSWSDLFNCSNTRPFRLFRQCPSTRHPAAAGRFPGPWFGVRSSSFALNGQWPAVGCQTSEDGFRTEHRTFNSQHSGPGKYLWLSWAKPFKAPWAGVPHVGLGSRLGIGVTTGHTILPRDKRFFSRIKYRFRLKVKDFSTSFLRPRRSGKCILCPNTHGRYYWQDSTQPVQI